MLVLTVKCCRAFESCPIPSVQHGADARNRTAKGILEIGRRSILSKREGGGGRNVNKDCVKAETNSFVFPLS